MPQAVPSPIDCCTPCEDDITTQIPGPQGAAGAAGANGTDGSNAFTTLTAGFTMPAELADATITVVDTSWMVARQGAVQGQILYIGFAGHFEVRSITSPTQAVVRNLEDTANALYPDNAPPTTAIPNAARVSPAGLQGPDGTPAAGAAPDSASYWTRIPEAGLSGETALSLVTAGVLQQTAGVPAQAPLCTAIEALAANGLVARTTAATASARTITGTALEIAVTNGDGVAGNPTLALDPGVYRAGGTDVAVADGGTGASATAGARSNLGVNRTLQDILIYQHQLAAGTDAGDFTSGAWQTVPLNTEVADTGSHGSIAANTITLATGTYRVRWRMCGYQVDRFQSRLFNVTTASIAGLGSNAKSAATDANMTVSEGETRITIAAVTEDIRIEAQCETTNAGDGFGLANAFGGTQVYAGITLEKEVG